MAYKLITLLTYFIVLFSPLTNSQIMKTKTSKIITQISFCHQEEGVGGGPPPPLCHLPCLPPRIYLLLFGQAN
jgi:hypothetical protein